MSLLKKLICILAFTATSCLTANDSDSAILEATVDILPSQITNENPRLINPGIPVKLVAKIKNVGSRANQPGRLYVRFTFPKPLENQKNGTLFTTELVVLPPINPGQSAFLEFETLHSTPSLNDFIRNDWNLRHYQAVVVFGESEHIIGSVPLTFSCFYYPGQEHESPTAVPALAETLGN